MNTCTGDGLVRLAIRNDPIFLRRLFPLLCLDAVSSVRFKAIWDRVVSGRTARVFCTRITLMS